MFAKKNHCVAIAALGLMFSPLALHTLAAQDAVVTKVVTIRSLAMHEQVTAARAALHLCAANHVPAVVVIVDAAGNTRLQLVGDGAQYSLLDQARRKARTAALMRRSTMDLRNALAVNPGTHVPPDPDLLISPGGLPFRAGSEVVGAIGIAGGEDAQNDQCAQAAVDSLHSDLHPDLSFGTKRPVQQSVQ